MILDGEVRLLKARPVAELAGILKRPGARTVTLEEVDEAIALGATEAGKPS